jgi:hypothetical protein
MAVVAGDVVVFGRVERIAGRWRDDLRLFLTNGGFRSILSSSARFSGPHDVMKWLRRSMT